ncbi:MAG: TnpV protein [Bacilli bacterium]|nr:TnpV protein [Bacilli bacterium]
MLEVLKKDKQYLELIDKILEQSKEENDNKKGTINKYEMLRLDYLKTHKKALYTTLLMKDELTNHLISISKDSENLLNNLMESYKKSDERLSEKIKKVIILNGQNL